MASGHRPWFSTPANTALPELDLSGISTVANRELEEGELSQTSNSHPQTPASYLSRVEESSKAVLRGQTGDFEGDDEGSGVRGKKPGSLSGWAGDGETSDTGRDSSKFFLRTPWDENKDCSKNPGARGDSTIPFSSSPHQSLLGALPWQRQPAATPMSFLSRLAAAREEPLFPSSVENGSGHSSHKELFQETLLPNGSGDSPPRGALQDGLVAPKGRSVTFNQEPTVFNIYEREESFDLSAAGNHLSFDATIVQSSPFVHSSPDMFRMSQVQEELPTDNVFFKKPLAPPARIFSASSSQTLPLAPCNENLSQGASQVNTATASKLAAFSERLKALTSPALATTAKTPHKSNTTVRGSLVTPRNKTPDSRQATPRSTITGTPLGTSNNPTDPDCYVAVMEGRGAAKGEVGVAAINLASPLLVLCQFSDSATYPLTLTKLMALNPCHVVYPASNLDPIMGASTGVKLYDDISNKLSNTNLTPVHRRYFNEAKGLLTVKQVMVKEVSSLELQFHNKYYCLAAANALMRYVEFSLNHGFNRASLKIEYQGADQVTVIDPATAEHIELMSSLGPERNKLSLFGIMNHCKTKGGVKLLRSNLFQPPVDQQLVEARQEAVSELIDSINLYDDLRSLVCKFPNLEAVLSLCIKRVDIATNAVRVDSKIDQMIGLRQVMQLLPMLVTALQQTEQSGLLKKYSDILAKHTDTASLLFGMLNLLLNDNARLTKSSNIGSNNRAMAVRSDVNGLLDMSRQTFLECNDQLQRCVHQLAEELDLPLVLNSSNQKGFAIHLVSTRSKKYSIRDLPDAAQRVHKNRNVISFVTNDFLVKDQLIKNATKEISNISNALLDELLVEVREHIAFLYQLSETICNIDLLLSLAKVSMNQGYVCPEFGDEIAVRQGRHPILDTMPLDIVSNDIQADPFSRLHVLAGPNMSGKSTYLRQVVLLCIMAQLGSRVPAESALLRIPDRIFSRVSNRDCIETNSSTFMVEMQETSFILSNVGPTSLVIIDELGRGTSVTEGAAICYAVCEHLLLHSSSFVFLATHFTLMTRLADLHPCAFNHHFLPSRAGEEDEEQLAFSHKLVSGKAPPSHLNYGLQLAASSLQEDLIKKARSFAGKVERGRNSSFKENIVDQASLRAVVQLKRLRRSGLGGDELGEAVAEVRRQLLLETSGIGLGDVNASGDEEAFGNESERMEGVEESRESSTPRR